MLITGINHDVSGCFRWKYRCRHSLTFSLQPIEREPLIYHVDSMFHRSEDHSDLPDEFFEITMDDVRKRFAQLKSERWEGGSEWWQLTGGHRAV